jgi:hypothetical protein
MVRDLLEIVGLSAPCTLTVGNPRPLPMGGTPRFVPEAIFRGFPRIAARPCGRAPTEPALALTQTTLRPLVVAASRRQRPVATEQLAGRGWL